MIVADPSKIENMSRCHDFYNGDYYQDSVTGETMSVEKYYRIKSKAEQLRKCHQYILIEKCESLINNTFFFCDILDYYMLDRKKPAGTIILSKNEYLKTEGKTCYYRAYKGTDEIFLEVIANKQLKMEKVEEINEALLCTEKGHSVLYTKEQFIKEFIN